MDLKTPLYDCHVRWEGKIVPFAGYLLPVQYKAGVVTEHNAVRTKAGLFDVSHMGEVIIKGKDALSNLQNILTNDFTVMADGQCRYTLMCNEEGGIVDDLIVYKVSEEEYLLVLNAANTKKDLDWIKGHLAGEASMEDVSAETAQLALQGPKAHQILVKLCEEGRLPAKYYTFKQGVAVAGISCLVSKTGYTGEEGYEIYCKKEDAVQLWEAIMAAGEEEGVIPCGLGARDTLRLEAAMPLYGHEMDDFVTPFEAGLKFAVKMTKEDFIGKKALEEKQEPTRIRVGLKVTGRGIVREGCPLFSEGEPVGETTSGTHLPHMGWAGAMALVDKKKAATGTKLEAEVRGRRVEVEITALPFYRRK